MFTERRKKLLQPLRKRRPGAKQTSAYEDAGLDSAVSTRLEREIEGISTDCTACGVCRSQCAFLKKHGTPKGIVEGSNLARGENQVMAFECSLCGLCSAVCPEKLTPVDLFLTLRQEAVSSGRIDLSQYRPMLTYERIGTSRLFSYYGLPEGCRIVFFPGCTLPGTRPQATWRLFRHLQGTFPDLGIVLDCCCKPSHDLGRLEHFLTMFEEMERFLAGHGVEKVLLACPNCYKVFKEQATAFEVQTVYELLSGDAQPKGPPGDNGPLAVHDPCPLRAEKPVQDSVRTMLERMGLPLVEMKHRRKLTVCCGEGGSVGLIQSDLAEHWGRIRSKEAGGSTLVTYCAGCAGALGRTLPTLHILDLFFFPEKALRRKLRPAKSPWWYVNRLLLKRQLKRRLKPVVERVRSASAAKGRALRSPEEAP